MKNIGFEFSRCSWVLPNYVYVFNNKGINNLYGTVITEETWKHISPKDKQHYVKIRNEGLKIKAELINSTPYSYWRGGNLVTHSEGIGIKIENSVCPLNIENKNLLSVLQNSGISDGYLGGTFKLSIIDYTRNVFKLIPEDTRENEWKTRISEIYYDTSKPFSKTMIPGHLYISKTKKLWLCVSTDLNYYSKNLPGGYSLYSRLYSYSDIPRKVKMLVLLSPDLKDELESGKINTIQDYISLKTFGWGREAIYSDKYAGKDLGLYLSDDGTSWKNCILGLKNKENLNYRIYFLENLFIDDQDLKTSLINQLNENQRLKEDASNRNPETNKLYEKLGV